MLKQPCRAVGTFMVLDLTMASPAAFMQALLSMWKIHQDPRVEVAPLHPALLSESVEGAIIAEL